MRFLKFLKKPSKHFWGKSREILENLFTFSWNSRNFWTFHSRKSGDAFWNQLPKWFHTFVNSSIYSPEFPQMSPQLENKLQCFPKFTRHKMYENLNPKIPLTFSVVFSSSFFQRFLLLSFPIFSLDLLGAKVWRILLTLFKNFSSNIFLRSYYLKLFSWISRNISPIGE